MANRPIRNSRANHQENGVVSGVGETPVNSRNCRRGSQSTVGELEPEGRLRTDRGIENGGKGGNYEMHL